MQTFVSFVNRVLIFYQSVKLDAFRVSTDLKNIFAPDVDVWLLVATRKCVEEVEIDFTSILVYCDSSDDEDDRRGRDDGVQCYVVPVFIFSNASLVRLKLMRCEIKYSGATNWKSLKLLSLSEIRLSNDLIGRILSGSPSLQVLELFACSDYGIVNIKHESLRRFVINDYSWYPGRDMHMEIEISAPFIKSLEISGTLNTCKVLLSNCSSLVEAKIDFEVRTPLEEDVKECEKNVREILGKLRHVKNLTVGNQCLQVLTSMMDHEMSLQDSSCKCLTLLTQLETWNGIAILLRSSPLLQTLHIDMASSQYDNYYRRDSDEDSLLAIDKVPALKTLEIVTISGLVHGLHYYKRLITVAKFLLKNGKVLEKMVITLENGDYWCQWEYGNTEELLDLALKLLSLPRSSLKAVIELYG